MSSDGQKMNRPTEERTDMIFEWINAHSPLVVEAIRLWTIKLMYAKNFLIFNSVNCHIKYMTG